MPTKVTENDDTGKNGTFMVSSSSRDPLVILSKNQKIYFEVKKDDLQIPLYALDTDNILALNVAGIIHDSGFVQCIAFYEEDGVIA